MLIAAHRNAMSRAKILALGAHYTMSDGMKRTGNDDQPKKPQRRWRASTLSARALLLLAIIGLYISLGIGLGARTNDEQTASNEMIPAPIPAN